jgi:hypothetical protein
MMIAILLVDIRSYLKQIAENTKPKP